MLKQFSRYQATVSEQQRKRTLAIWRMLRDANDEYDSGNGEEERERVKECSDSRDD